MPRYFFHYHDARSHTDDEGIDLLSDRDAWEQGVRSYGQFIADLGGRMKAGEAYRLECKDESGFTVFVIGCMGMRRMG